MSEKGSTPVAARGAAVLDAVLSAIIVVIAAAVLYCAFTLVPKVTVADPVAVPEAAPDEIHLGPVRGRTKAFVLEGLSVSGQSVPFSGKLSKTVSRGDAIVASGWAADDATKRAASRIVAQVGCDFTIAAVTIPRPDVAAAFHLDAGSRSGFTIHIPTSDLAPGKHVIHFLIVGSDGSTLLDTGASIAFAETASLAALHPLVTLDSINGLTIDSNAQTLHVGSGAWTLSGWAVGDVAAAVPFAVLRFYIDGKLAATVSRGDARPDVAAFLKTPILASAGFTAHFRPLLDPGEHQLTVSLAAPDGRSSATQVSRSIAR